MRRRRARIFRIVAAEATRPSFDSVYVVAVVASRGFDDRPASCFTRLAA
jgi:hypothetical protein